MKIYLAAPFDWQGRMKIIRETLHFQPGLQVVSRWLDETPADYNPAANAAIDLSDIRAADVLILSSDATNGRGGMHVEFGYALGRGIKVAVVGTQYNIFHYLPEVQYFTNWPDCIAWLNKEQREQNLSPVNLVASIDGRSSAGPDQQQARVSRPGDDGAGATQGQHLAPRYVRWVTLPDSALETRAALQAMVEGAD